MQEKLEGYKKFYIYANDKIVMANYYNLSPSELLQNEWVVFAGVFLVVFAMVFLALSRQFSSKKKDPWGREWMDKHSIDNKAIPGIIALVIAFFSAAAFVKNNLIEGIFGEALTIWIFLLVLIVLVMLSIPFYKALKQNVGGGIAIFIIVVGLWTILKFGFDPFQYNLPYGFYEIYELVVHPVFLIILIVVGGMVALIKKSGRK